jgi:hypothetical protein
MKREFEGNGADKHVFSNVIKAGQRTYFFDVKINRNNDYYLVITESKKRLGQDGRPVFDKFKIQLYHENIGAFSETLREIAEYIQGNSTQSSGKEFSQQHPDEW